MSIVAVWDRPEPGQSRATLAGSPHELDTELRPGAAVKRRTPGVSVVRLEYPADEGANTVWFGQGRVVVKADGEPHLPSKLVANEFVCARLAMALGVPVPMGDAGLLAGENLVWVSAQVEYDGQVFPPADVAKAAAERPWDVAALATFDVWVGNEDRHDLNVIYHPEVGFWGIDFEKSLGGESAGDSQWHDSHRTEAPRLWALDGVDLPRSYFAPWAERIKGFPRSGLEATLKEARYRDLLTMEEAKAIQEWLEFRQVRIRELLDSSLNWSKPNKRKEEGSWPTQPELGTS